MIDLAFIYGIFESMVKTISAIWNIIVLPYKPIWIVIVIAVLGKFYFRKSRTN